MLLAHFAAGGGEALDLPAWALAYGVFAISVIVVLVSRQRHVATPPPRVAPTTSDHRVRPVRGITAVLGAVSAIVFWLLVGFCWFGPEALSQNLAPLALVGVLWSLGGWVAAAFGWCWEAIDPFAVFARRDDASPAPAPPGWAPVPVFATWVVVWIAWIPGDEPRHLAVWATLYGVAMIVTARVGGRRWLTAANPLPVALDLTAAITRPTRARSRTLDPARRRRVGLVAGMLLGAIAANRVSRTGWFTAHVAAHGEFVATVGAIAVFAAGSAVILGIWRGCELFVERARDEPGGRPLIAVLGPVAGAVLAAQALPIGLVQVQNLVVLASDPFAQGWNLFGTVYWQVSPQLLSPFVQGLVQVGAIVAGHAAAVMATGRAATARGVDGGTSARGRHRRWTAAGPAMAVTVVSGVVWTLVLLG